MTVKVDTSIATNVTKCACKSDKKDDQSAQRLFVIEFENYLQNYVYRKRPNRTPREGTNEREKSNNVVRQRGALNSLQPPTSNTMSTTAPSATTNATSDIISNSSGNPVLNSTDVSGDNNTVTKHEDTEEDGSDNEYLVAVVYNKLEVVLPNLLHFTTYSIEVRRCFHLLN